MPGRTERGQILGISKVQLAIILMVCSEPLRIHLTTAASVNPECRGAGQVYENVRHFLQGRHRVQFRGTDGFFIEAVFGEPEEPPAR